MRVVALLGLASAAACQSLPPGASNSEIIDTTIAAVLADPDTFHGKTIRVAGILNICVSFDCKLCEGITKSDECLNSSIVEEAGADANWRANKRLEALYRFTKMTIVGKFNASCLTHKSYGTRPNKVTTEIVLCTDRATTFVINRVEQVHERFPATRFISSWYLTDKLVAVPEAESGDVVAA